MPFHKSADQFGDTVKGKISSLIANVLDVNDRIHTENSLDRIDEKIRSALRVMGIEQLTNLQSDFLSKVWTNGPKFVLSSAPGTGKTIAYGIAIFDRIDKAKNHTQVLCLCSTYEAAVQTQNVLCQMALNSGIVIGSAVQGENVCLGQKLKCHVVVGTPKEIISFKLMRQFNVEQITHCVIDDADTIATTTVVKQQIIHALHQATKILFVQSGRGLSYLDFMQPFDICSTHSPLNLEQFFSDCQSNVEKLKFALLFANELARLKIQGLIFLETRELAEIVGKFLGLKGVRVAICHAGMSYENRKKAVDELRSGSVDVAVTTNVLVRAIDIPTVRAVMNFELPQNNNENAPLSADIKRYWYRIGRATRFGQRGIVINLASPNEQKAMFELIERNAMKPIFI